MNYRFLLNLVAFPAVASSILTMTLMVNHASAAEVSPISVSCDAKPTNLQATINHRSNQGLLIASSDVTSLDFSDAESDAAAALFNCDCPGCINALRQLRSQPLTNQSQGHCWANLQEQVSANQLKEVLQTLEKEEQKL
jgi:hypothetical protein